MMDALDRLVILGAEGDLSTRLLLPAIARALEADEFPAALRIVGVARHEQSREEYQERSWEELGTYAPEVGVDTRQRLVNMLDYVQADATDPDALSAAFDDRPAVVYFALPPVIYPGVIDALESIGLPEGSRVVVEKPFGEDLDSAIELNRQLKRVFPEDCIYRIDHFTALQAVEAIPAMRFGNHVFEPVWNREHIQQVDIIWDDTLALEGRAGYYDTAGALKDMLQNHLMQVMIYLGMEPPADLGTAALRERKVELLRSIRPWSLDDAAEHSYRARYTAGEIEGRSIPNYVDEEGVEPDNRTETYAEVRLFIDNDRWRDVPFVLRSGKAQGHNRRVANITFRDAPESPFGRQTGEKPNVLQLQMLPDRLYLSMMLSRPEDFTRLRPVHFGLDMPEEVIPAHGSLVLDVLRGDQRRFIRDDEAEESWRVVQPFLNAWSRDLVPLEEYDAGTIVQTGFTVGDGN